MRWGQSPYKKKETITPIQSEVVVFGTSWCGMTQLVRRFLDSRDISYKYLDIEEDDGAENQLRWVTGGFTSHPTVIINGQVLIEPEIDELEDALEKNRLL
jgi:mycoredoxin